MASHETVEDKVEQADRAGVVYAVDCKDCDLSNIRETSRKVTRCVKKHKAHAELNCQPGQNMVGEVTPKI